MLRTQWPKLRERAGYKSCLTQMKVTTRQIKRSSTSLTLNGLLITGRTIAFERFIRFRSPLLSIIGAIIVNGNHFSLPEMSQPMIILSTSILGRAECSKYPTDYHIIESIKNAFAIARYDHEG